MKLNYKTTFYIGLIFFSISMFWQAYDMLIARTLIDKFGLNQFESGIVMALDNVMAVILLPLFGMLSDRTKRKSGRRTPYIIVGTFLAAFSFMSFSFIDYYQTEKMMRTEIRSDYDYALDGNTASQSHWLLVVERMETERNDTYQDGKISLEALEIWETTIYHPMTEILANGSTELNVGDEARVRDFYFQYLSLRAREMTDRDPTTFYLFLALIFVAIVAMGIYRTPAVALMPDVTINPLRTTANAIITLMGVIGGVIAVFIIMFSGLNAHAYAHHVGVYVAVGILMIIALIVYLFRVNEPALVEQRIALEEEYQIQPPLYHTKPKLNRQKRISLGFLLTSIFFLFFGYNAIMSKIADYLPKVLNLEFYQFPFLVAQGLVVAAIYPIGLLSIKIGRKNSILIGIFLLIVTLGSVVFVKPDQMVGMALIIAFAGFGWSFAGINIYIMVVELSKGSNVGQYTGYYYAASMGAQIITPMFSGFLMDTYGRIILFPYATISMVLALLAMLFVKHGDAKFPEFKKLFKKRT